MLRSIGTSRSPPLALQILQQIARSVGVERVLRDQSLLRAFGGLARQLPRQPPIARPSSGDGRDGRRARRHLARLARRGRKSTRSCVMSSMRNEDAPSKTRPPYVTRTPSPRRARRRARSSCSRPPPGRRRIGAIWNRPAVDDGDAACAFARMQHAVHANPTSPRSDSANRPTDSARQHVEHALERPRGRSANGAACRTRRYKSSTR